MTILDILRPKPMLWVEVEKLHGANLVDRAARERQDLADLISVRDDLRIEIARLEAEHANTELAIRAREASIAVYEDAMIDRALEEIEVVA